MKKGDLEAMKEAYADVPSQDNEGYTPDRGGFKCGWFAALRWEREKTEPRLALAERKLAIAFKAMCQLDRVGILVARKAVRKIIKLDESSEES